MSSAEVVTDDTTTKVSSVVELRRDDNWVYLSESSAKAHPLYGVEGWAALIWFSLVVITPIATVLQLTLSGETGGVFTFGLLGGVATTAWSWFIGYLLFSHDSRFQFHYSVLVGVGLAFSGLAIFQGPNGIAIFIRESIIALAWLTYVHRSRRINVTTLKRVRITDPYLNS